MDELLRKAYQVANANSFSRNQIRLLKEKAQARLHFAKYGGLFQITPQLILYVKTQLELGRDNLVILDKNENPIFIEDLQEFFDEIAAIEAEVMNKWYADYMKVSKWRDPKELLDE